MKRIVSTLLALMFVFSAFSVTSVFSGIIAEAEFYDYFIYTRIEGFHSFTDEELAKFEIRNTTNVVNGMVGDMQVLQWELTKPDEWNCYDLRLFYGRNMKAANNTEGVDINGMDAALDFVNGKSLMGDLTFKGQNGISFWVGKNGENYNGELAITLKKAPCKGPYFSGKLDNEEGRTAEELAAEGLGFSYESIGKHPDADGYVHFDFQTDFKQVDWWSTDDNGVNQSGQGVQPIPKSKYKDISAFKFNIRNADVGDVITIGDICMFRDSRIKLDGLDEILYIFEGVNPEEYTEESMGIATEAYLEAFDIYSDPDVKENYTQEQIDDAVEALKKAIAALKPLFPKRSENVTINGFEVIDDDDVELIVSGGITLDAAYITDEPLPEGVDVDASIAVLGGAFAGEPSYGWSNFTTAILGDEGTVAVKNVFGAENLGEAAGFRFWLKLDPSYEPVPTSFIIGAGSSELGAYFETEAEKIKIGADDYVSVPWSSLSDFNGEFDIYDCIDKLDYVTIRIFDCAQQVYYVSDLHAFEWSLTPADFTELDAKIVDIQAYLATLNRVDWSVRSWQRVEAAIEAGRALHSTYGATQGEVNNAIEAINSAVLRLTPANDTATLEEVNALENAFRSASDYWRGNYTPVSYINLRNAVLTVKPLIEDEMSSADCIEYTRQLNEAIAGLVSVTHTEIGTSIYSFEKLSSREFAKMTGHRTDTVEYELVTSKNAEITLPEGYEKALHMTSKEEKTTKTTDQHGNMQFKLFDQYDQTLFPDVEDPENPGNMIGGAIGNLTGTSGIRLWVGVNDIKLFKDATFRFGVSNCSEGPLFEMHCVDIPFPSTGSGWLYLPWEYFEYYDEWTHGEMINLMEIRFYIVRVDGIVPEGAEIYVTGISAYTDTKPTENVDPVVGNITEGATIDVSENALVPVWNVGSASLNGVRFNYGDEITVNGDYTLVVTNANKQTTVNFTVTGGQSADATPIITGVVDGGVYEEEVTINWDVGVATLNGAEIEKGTIVSAGGSYTLQVVNGTKSVVVRFTVEGEEEPEYTRGDLDKDGVITVSDALVALRVAAKMAEETEEIIAIGDADSDGKITVSDALAILRVAAKMAESI